MPRKQSIIQTPIQTGGEEGKNGRTVSGLLNTFYGVSFDEYSPYDEYWIFLKPVLFAVYPDQYVFPSDRGKRRPEPADSAFRG